MKHLKHLTAALVFVSLIVFTNCGPGEGGDNPDPADEQAEKLSADWTLVVNGAELGDGGPATAWNGFTLTIDGTADGGSFTTTGSQCIEVWPTSGTWEFDNNDIGTVLRNDGASVDVTVTSSNLTLVFTLNSGDTCTSPSRTESVDGTWTFSFSK